MAQRLMLCIIDTVYAWSAANLQLFEALCEINVSTRCAAEVAFAASELTRNALEHAGEGQLTVSWSRSGDSAILEVVVTDRGPGIAGLIGPFAPAHYGGGLTLSAQLFSTLQVQNRMESGVQAVARLEINIAEKQYSPRFELNRLSRSKRELETENAQLKKFVGELESALRNQCQFILDLCHRVRTPVHNLVRELERYAPDTKTAEIVDLVRRKTGEALIVVDDLLDVESPTRMNSLPELRHCQEYGFYGPMPYPGGDFPD